MEGWALLTVLLVLVEIEATSPTSLITAITSDRRGSFRVMEWQGKGTSTADRVLGFVDEFIQSHKTIFDLGHTALICAL